MALWPLLWTEQVRESTLSAALGLVLAAYLGPLSLVILQKKEAGSVAWWEEDRWESSGIQVTGGFP